MKDGCLWYYFGVLEGIICWVKKKKWDRIRGKLCFRIIILGILDYFLLIWNKYRRGENFLRL